MIENDLDKIVELLFVTFEEKHSHCDLSPKGMSECFSELSSSLNTEQKKLLHKLDNFEIEAYIYQVKAAIKYVLQLLCPKY